ncbi:hypothetical protein THAOC_07351 [Thalassiosira oceanica]|uniref:SWIM-type domain-containing protein n=1 Tax=Thalassiosira oceanica TaxID=159749 RepID=K0TCQ3_THAOC|nr:hypothetical protein THAOC_07351 [Thalassiosira oceanica]|eukprot:EJK71231.1 hypothetical protein THAOC_07351 [Thalassiosira oceanica]
MDAMTTSPVEGNNCAIKKGPSRIHSQMNLSKSLPRVYEGINARIERSSNKAKRDITRLSYSSRALTADFVNEKGQALVDRNFDSRFIYKGAQISEEGWLVWCFTKKRHEELKSEPWCYLPSYQRVHQLRVMRNGEKLFLHCSCGFYHRTGIPCPHFFYLVDEIDLIMIHVRYWKVYHAFFNEDSDIGRYLTKAQAQHFENRMNGVPIRRHHLEALRAKVSMRSFPACLEGTTEADWKQANFVMSRDACTSNELAQFDTSSEDDVSFGENGGDSEFDFAEECTTYKSEDAKRMHSEIAASAVRCDKMSTDEQTMCWKNCTEDCKAVLESHLPRNRKKDFEREISLLRLRYMSELRPVEAVGKDGGIEMCATHNNEREHRSQRYLSSTDYRKSK